MFELHSDVCDLCDAALADWPEFGDDEARDAHTLLNSSSYYQHWWTKSAAAAFSTAGGSSLPAAMIAQLRVRVTDLASAREYFEAIWPELSLETAGDGSTKWFSARVRTGAYDTASGGTTLSSSSQSSSRETAARSSEGAPRRRPNSPLVAG